MAVSYPINKSDGSLAFNITPGTINTNFNVTLLGKGATNYGEVVAENFMHMIENFASSDSPENNPNLSGLPTTGQFWYDTANKTIKIYDQTLTPSWREMVIIGEGGSSGTPFPTSPVDGQVFYLTVGIVGYPAGLYYWNNATARWIPASAPLSGATLPAPSPTTFIPGQLFYKTSAPTGLYYWDGAAWQSVGLDATTIAYLDSNYLNKVTTSIQHVTGPVSFNNTSYMKIPAGSTAQQPGTLADTITIEKPYGDKGSIRYNTDTDRIELWKSTPIPGWYQMSFTTDPGNTGPTGPTGATGPTGPIGSVTYATTAELLALATTSKAVNPGIIGQALAEISVPYAANITLNLNSGLSFTTTLTGNTVLENPIGTVIGTSGYIIIKQDGIGSRLVTFGTNWIWSGGSAPVASTAPNASDILFFYVLGGGKILGGWVGDIK